MVFILCTALTGCTSLRQALQNRPCVLDPNHPYDVISVNPVHDQIVLYWRNPTTGTGFRTVRTLKAWLETQQDSVIAITNAGIYEPTLVPTGLYIEEGHLQSPLNLKDGYGNFYLKPNGIFFISADRVGVIDASKFGQLKDSILYAIQSGPLLLTDGQIHPAFMPDSRNCRLRSGIGVTRNGIVHIAITNGAVNFNDFATFFRDELGAHNALYLDGAISTLYAPQLNRTALSRTRFAVFLVVRRKQ